MRQKSMLNNSLDVKIWDQKNKNGVKNVKSLDKKKCVCYSECRLTYVSIISTHV